MENVKNEMKLEFLSRSANEAFARIAVASFASQLDPTIEELADIKTSVSEAVTNSIIHAYDGKEGVIKIHSKLYENEIEIEVMDSGVGIENIEEAKAPLFTTKGNLERSGMGFTIMENFMDELKVESVVRAWNENLYEKNHQNKRIGGNELKIDEKYLMNEVQSGNQDALEILIKQNNGLIWCIVRRFYGRGYDLEDLYQIGSIGFIKAVKRFNMGYDYKLSTFAVPYIMGEIKKFMRDDGMIKVSRRVKELSFKVKEIEKDYFARNGESVTIKELAKMLEESEENICCALECGRQIESINEVFTENGKEEKIERVIGRMDEQNKIVDKIAVDDMVNKLSLRDKTIIKLRYFKEKTQVQVAKILGISQVQVSRIEKKILDDMKEKMVG